MIRTKVVELSSIEAFAYRQKRKGGLTGIKIMRPDSEQPGLATLNKGTGEPEPAANTDVSLYPLAAFDEAAELTEGLPYNRRGVVKLSSLPVDNNTDDDDAEDEVIVDSSEYAAIVAAYTNRRGELSYELLNRDLIQLVKSHGGAAQLIADHASVEDVRALVVRERFMSITKNIELTSTQVERIVNMLDETSRRGVFRELNDEIRKMMARR